MKNFLLSLFVVFFPAIAWGEISFYGGVGPHCEVKDVRGDTVGTDADTAEKTLYTYTLPGGSLNSSGDFVWIDARGQMGANGNVKTPRLYFGSTVIASTAGAWNNLYYFFHGPLIMTGTATQKGIMRLDLGSTGTGYDTAPTEDETGDVVIKLTGQNGTAVANDIRAFGWVVYLCSAP